SHINKTIDHTAYPYTRDPTGDPDEGKVLPQGPVSLRSARAGWSKKGQTTVSPRIIVFVAGGVTYSELRTAYELSEKYNQEVIIGSTHVITPQQFIDDLKRLRRQPNKPNQPYSSPQPQPMHTPPPRAGNQNYNEGSDENTRFNRLLQGTFKLITITHIKYLSKRGYVRLEMQTVGSARLTAL
ncbi:15751_t:CDS:2, partial [Gigaspora rosea]